MVEKITIVEATVQKRNDKILNKTKSWTNQQLSQLQTMKQNALAFTDEIENKKGKLQSMLE